MKKKILSEVVQTVLRGVDGTCSVGKAQLLILQAHFCQVSNTKLVLK